MHTLAQLRSGALRGAITLKLAEQLTHFPEEIFELADTLEVLDLSGNQLSALPKDFGRLKRLRILFCSDNPFTVLPDVLGDCPLLDIVGFKANQIETIPPRSLNPNLRWLILTNNRIKNLPPEIGRCERMQKLMLAGNRLTELPEQLSNCRNLSLLRISANQLTFLPEWLLSMPRLSWLAMSGNPFSITHSDTSPPFISWTDLTVSHILGEGASGVIFKGVLKSVAGTTDVAIKLFKGAVTSDGLPEDEINTFITAGCHPGLVGLTGQIAGHPDNRKGLVMELIPSRFYTLGLPPSMESCTRDVFPESACISADQALKIATTIASVAQQLHSKGIMHGDLYAHNTLTDTSGNALLSDFGAASLYDKTNTQVARSLERIEVCAFGHLLDDLIFLCKNTVEHEPINKLKALRDACKKPGVLSRPGFKSLYNELKNPDSLK